MSGTVNVAPSPTCDDVSVLDSEIPNPMQGAIPASHELYAHNLQGEESEAAQNKTETCAADEKLTRSSSIPVDSSPVCVGKIG